MTKRAVVLLAALAAGCASIGASGPPSAWRPPPPRLPGTSITHTQLCECTACSPASCCVDEGLSAPDGDAYGLAVTSCASRCERYVYRIPLARSCDEQRPSVCCRG